jgi:hypothetical protein
VLEVGCSACTTASLYNATTHARLSSISPFNPMVLATERAFLTRVLTTIEVAVVQKNRNTLDYILPRDTIEIHLSQGLHLRGSRFFRW